MIYIPLFFGSLLTRIDGFSESRCRWQCSSNIKQIVLAMHNYHDAYQSLPPAYTVDKNGKPLHSWRVLILPYLEEGELYQKIRLDEPWDSEYNQQFHDEKISYYQCPTFKKILNRKYPQMNFSGMCNYSVVIGDETPFPGAEAIAFDQMFEQIPMFGQIPEGCSNTIFVVERMTPVNWMDPTHEITFATACKGINSDFYGLGSEHTAHGCSVVFADGAVQFLLDDEKCLKEKLHKDDKTPPNNIP